MEDGSTVSVMLGIDFQKAFNRVKYNSCVEQLEHLGAPLVSLSLVKSFLMNRKMAIKIVDERSDLKEITRGCPQGSALYCVTTQSFHEPSDRREDAHCQTLHQVVAPFHWPDKPCCQFLQHQAPTHSTRHEFPSPLLLGRLRSQLWNLLLRHQPRIWPNLGKQETGRR